jgi:hypothetical protein
MQVQLCICIQIDERIISMPEYQSSLVIKATPANIEDFISQVDNLPKYLPTTRKASSSAGENDNVRVQGQAHGHSYVAEGHFHFDEAKHRMEWSSDDVEKYSGWLQVSPLDGGSSSNVVVHLKFDTPANLKKELSANTGSQDKEVQEGLDAALTSIKNLCEGHGSKVEPKSAK